MNFVQFCKKNALNVDSFNFFKMTLASVIKQLYANGKGLKSDFHRASLIMAWLHLY